MYYADEQEIQHSRAYWHLRVVCVIANGPASNRAKPDHLPPCLLLQWTSLRMHATWNNQAADSNGCSSCFVELGSFVPDVTAELGCRQWPSTCYSTSGLQVGSPVMYKGSLLKSTDSRGCLSPCSLLIVNSVSLQTWLQLSAPRLSFTAQAQIAWLACAGLVILFEFSAGRQLRYQQFAAASQQLCCLARPIR